MKKRFLFLIFIVFCALTMSAQTLSSVRSRWSDSFVEWDLFATYPPELDTTQLQEKTETASDEPTELEEEEFGDLKLRWLALKDDWSEWDFSLGGERGTIKQKWKEDKTQWELRTYDGAVVTMRAAWANDLTEWRVTDNTTTLIFRSRWSGQYDEWVLRDKSQGQFYVYTLRSRDPRDWAIEDSLDESISLPIKMAMVFLAIYHGSPKQ